MQALLVQVNLSCGAAVLHIWVPTSLCTWYGKLKNMGQCVLLSNSKFVWSLCCFDFGMRIIACHLPHTQVLIHSVLLFCVHLSRIVALLHFAFVVMLLHVAFVGMPRTSGIVALKLGGDVIVRLQRETPIEDLLQQLERACAGGRIQDAEGFDVTPACKRDLPGGEYNIVQTITGDTIRLPLFLCAIYLQCRIAKLNPDAALIIGCSLAYCAGFTWPAVVHGGFGLHSRMSGTCMLGA